MLGASDKREDGSSNQMGAKALEGSSLLHGANLLSSSPHLSDTRDSMAPQSSYRLSKPTAHRYAAPSSLDRHPR